MSRKTIPATEAAKLWGQQVAHAREIGPVVVTDNGTPKVAIVHFDALQVMVRAAGVLENERLVAGIAADLLRFAGAPEED